MNLRTLEWNKLVVVAVVALLVVAMLAIALMIF